MKRSTNSSRKNSSAQTELQKKFGENVKVYESSDAGEFISDMVTQCNQVQNEFYDRIQKNSYEPPVWKRRHSVLVTDDLAIIPRSTTHLCVSAKAKNLSTLRDFPNLEFLEFQNANDKAIAELQFLKGVRTLLLQRGTYTNLSAIVGLGSLVDLIFYQNVKLERLDGLEKLTRLRTLSLEGMRRVRSIAPIKTLKELIGFRVAHGYVAGMTDFVAIHSVQAIAGLKKLQMVDLTGAKILDDDFSPLLKLPALEDLRIGPTNKLDQLAFLAAHFPTLFQQWSGPLWKTYACHRCGTFKARYIGPDKAHWCPKCHEKKITERLTTFASLVEKQRSIQVVQT